MKLFLIVTVLQSNWVASFESRTAADAELLEVRDATASPDGTRLFVLDGRAGQIHVFNSAGGRVAVFGRRGQGPGELGQGAYRLGWGADTLWVMERPDRLHFFQQSGRLVRTITVPAGTFGSSGVGGFLVRERVQRAVNTAAAGPVAITHQTASTRTRLAEFDDLVAPVQVSIRVNGRAGTGFQQQPFNDAPLYVADRAGRNLVIVQRNAARSPPHAFRVLKIRLGGDTVFARAYPYRPRPLDRAAFAEALKEAGGVIGSGGTAKVSVDLAGLEKAIYRPNHVPAVSNALIGSDGTIWLQLAAEPDARSTRYQVLAASGEPLATITLPRREKLVEASAGGTWTIARDEDDAPFLKRYRIDR